MGEARDDPACRLAFPVARRRRSAFTVGLLGLITFLVMLVVMNNGSTVAQSGSSQVAGGFDLGVENVPPTAHSLERALARTPQTIPHTVAHNFAQIPHCYTIFATQSI